MSLIVVATELASAIFNAAIIMRLSGRSSPTDSLTEALQPLLPRWQALLLLALVSSTVRIIYVSANQLISPLLGSLLLPMLLKRLSSKRKHVST